MLCTVYVVYECALSAGLDLPGGLGGFNPQDRSLTPPAKVGQMYWGGGCKLTPPGNHPEALFIVDAIDVKY